MSDLVPKLTLDRPDSYSFNIPYKKEVNIHVATEDDVWEAFADYLRFSITEIKKARAKSRN